MRVDTETGSAQAERSEGVLLEHLKSGVALLKLGAPDEHVVTLTTERMQSLEQAIDQLKNERPSGLVITGPRPGMFTVGADVKIFQALKTPEEAEAAAKAGQRIFDKIEALPFRTVAAIDGPCVGGGCELALACDLRLISESEGSLIGLPEIKLGIIPGFGGTQRLPRLIGLPRALDVILAGKTLRGKQALSRGLVNEIVPADQLLTRAERYASGAGHPRRSAIPLLDRALSFTTIGRKIVRRRATADVQRKTKNFYPAPPAALETAIFGLEHGLPAGLDREAKELGRLLVSPESRSLVHVFFRSEDAKSIGKSARKAVEHIQGVVVGAGVMGAGIAGLLAKNGCQVILKDTTEEGLERGVEQIRKSLEQLRYLSEQERSFILNRIERTTRDSSNTGNANFAIEAVFEKLEVKQQVLSHLADLMPEDSIIATNTSSLSIAEIASAIPKPERVVGMHFFNPVDKMPLVEIVRGENTSDATVAKVAALATKLGKFPIVVADVPGFLVNRILTPYLKEAAHLLEEGVSIVDIDAAALSFGMPMGPIRLLDEVGLDVAAHVSDVLVAGYGERMQGPGYINKLLEAGRKGKKSGAGYYRYQDGKHEHDAEVYQLLGLNAPSRSLDRKEIVDRLIFSLVNEAVRCLDEGVAGAPGREAARQIDLGTVMGAGFPPFRGGLMYFADTLGAQAVFERMQALRSSYGDRFQPANGIATRARLRKSFFEAV